MAIWYVNYVTGNDSSAGTSWATAFKTFGGVTPAKGFVSGDTVQVAKSPDPTSLGQTAQWTDQTKSVVLSNPVTLDIDQCEIAWIKGAATSTSLNTATQRQGTAAASIAFGSTTANTLYAYDPIGPLDLSQYQQISFWINTPSNGVVFNNWRLCLCSDNAGQTIVYSVPIPSIPAASSLWMACTVDMGSLMTNATAIQSIALYSGTTTATSGQLSLDNIIACKPPNAPDSLTLTSLIGKNNGTEPFFAIQSITGTSIAFDQYGIVTIGNTKAYFGVTENVTTYKRETTKTNLSSGSYQAHPITAIPANSQISFSGGWNTVSNVQDGETFFDGQNWTAIGIYLNVSSAIGTFQNISVLRYTTGYSLSVVSFGNSVKCYQVTNCSTTGILPGNSFMTTCNVMNVCFNNAGIQAGPTNALYLMTNLNSNVTGMSVGGQGNTIQVPNCRGNTTGISLSGAGWGVTILNALLANNTIDINLSGVANLPYVYLKNCKLTSSTPLSFSASPVETRVTSHNDQQIIGQTKITSDGMTIVSDRSTVHTANGIAWKLSLVTPGGYRNTNFPAKLVIAKVFCPANQTRTFQAWFMRSENLHFIGQLVVRGLHVNGIPNDVSHATTAPINMWEQLAVTVTPTEDAVIEVEAWAFTPDGTVGGNLWVADFSAT